MCYMSASTTHLGEFLFILWPYIRQRVNVQFKDPILVKCSPAQVEMNGSRARVCHIHIHCSESLMGLFPTGLSLKGSGSATGIILNVMTLTIG